MNKKHLIAYPLTAVLALGIGAASAGGSSAPQSSAPTTVTATVPAPAPAAGQPSPATTSVAASPSATPTTPAASGTTEAEIPGDGTYEVGIDISPGTYVSDTPDSGDCYWARRSSQDSLSGIITNNLTKGRSVVTVAKTDKFFETRGCNPWIKR